MTHVVFPISPVFCLDPSLSLSLSLPSSPSFVPINPSLHPSVSISLSLSLSLSLLSMSTTGCGMWCRRSDTYFCRNDPGCFAYMQCDALNPGQLHSFRVLGSASHVGSCRGMERTWKLPRPHLPNPRNFPHPSAMFPGLLVPRFQLDNAPQQHQSAASQCATQPKTVAV